MSAQDGLRAALAELRDEWASRGEYGDASLTQGARRLSALLAAHPAAPDAPQGEVVTDYGIQFADDFEPDEWFDDKGFGDARVAAEERMSDLRADVKRYGWNPDDYAGMRLMTRQRTVTPDRTTPWQPVEAEGGGRDDT